VPTILLYSSLYGACRLFSKHKQKLCRLHYIVKLESGERFEIVEESMIDDIIPSGKKVCLTVKAKKINLFTKDGSKSLVI